VAAGVALLVRLFALSLQEAAADDPSLNVAQYAFPLLVSAGAAIVLIRAGVKAKVKTLREEATA
jgi:hypothetical protein